jgi:hypothetical protein
MMSDKEFAELELRATICPGQCKWPKPTYVHWQKLHDAATPAMANFPGAATRVPRAEDSRVRLPVEDAQRHMTTSAGRNHGGGVGDLIVRRGQPSKRHNQCHPCSRSCYDNGVARTI